MRFKVRDTVYHFNYGKGEVIAVYETTLTVKFENIDMARTFGKEGGENTLSFEPYDLVNGGFSTVRKLPRIELGEPLFVKGATDIWELRFFSHFGSNGEIYTFANQKPEGSTVSWLEYSLTNPFK